MLGLLLIPFWVSGSTIQDNWFVETEDGKLYLEVSGLSNASELILFLHGGPGDVELGMLPFKENVGKLLEKQHLIAYLHQRGAGKSTGFSNDSLTVASNVNDVRLVIQDLREKYGKQRVTIVGHSWGGALAGAYAVEFPETVSHLVFMSTFQDAKKQVQFSLNESIAWATQVKNLDALKELESIENAENANEHWRTLAKWSSQANGGIGLHFDFMTFIHEQKINENYPNWQSRRNLVADAMQGEFRNIALEKRLSEINIPALFIVGERDSITPAALMKSDFNNYQGRKHFVLLSESHHLPYTDEPAEVAKAIMSFMIE
jgi:pimeloyl-ACP methyl ester carboxylesterase